MEIGLVSVAVVAVAATAFLAAWEVEKGKKGTLGIGDACGRDNNCDVSGFARDKGDPLRRPSSFGSAVGCCGGSCAFRRRNFQNNMRCASRCKSCLLCKPGADSSKPCKISEAEKEYNKQRGVVKMMSLTKGHKTKYHKTLGIGSKCKKSSECDVTGVARGNGVGSAVGKSIGCCGGKCAFRRTDYVGIKQCTEQCKSCLTCKMGSKSSKPCRISQAEIDFDADRGKLIPLVKDHQFKPKHWKKIKSGKHGKTTKGIGEGCKNDKECDYTGYSRVNGKGSSFGKPVGCCKGQCAFRKVDKHGKLRCKSHAAKPYHKSLAEKAWDRKHNVHNTRSYKKDQTIDLSVPSAITNLDPNLTIVSAPIQVQKTAKYSLNKNINLHSNTIS